MPKIESRISMRSVNQIFMFASKAKMKNMIMPGVLTSYDIFNHR